MNWEVFIAVVAALVLVLGWKLWLSLVVIAVAFGITFLRFIFFDLWVGLFSGVFTGVGNFIEGVGEATTRPGRKFGVAVWAKEHRYHKWHMKMAATYGPNWWKQESEGGLWDEYDRKLPPERLKAIAAAYQASQTPR